jgi:hypothetical protein
MWEGGGLAATGIEGRRSASTTRWVSGSPTVRLKSVQAGCR